MITNLTKAFAYLLAGFLLVYLTKDPIISLLIILATIIAVSIIKHVVKH